MTNQITLHTPPLAGFLYKYPENVKDLTELLEVQHSSQLKSRGVLHFIQEGWFLLPPSLSSSPCVMVIKVEFLVVSAACDGWREIIPHIMRSIKYIQTFRSHISAIYLMLLSRVSYCSNLNPTSPVFLAINSGATQLRQRNNDKTLVPNVRMKRVCQRVDDSVTIKLEMVKASWASHPSGERLLRLVKQLHATVSWSE